MAADTRTGCCNAPLVFVGNAIRCSKCDPIGKAELERLEARPLMADTLSIAEQLRRVPKEVHRTYADICREAAAELDRRDAIVAAAEACAHTYRAWLEDPLTGPDYHRAMEALAALLPEAD